MIKKLKLIKNINFNPKFKLNSSFIIKYLLMLLSSGYLSVILKKTNSKTTTEINFFIRTFLKKQKNKQKIVIFFPANI